MQQRKKCRRMQHDAHWQAGNGGEGGRDAYSGGQLYLHVERVSSNLQSLIVFSLSRTGNLELEWQLATATGNCNRKQELATAHMALPPSLSAHTHTRFEVDFVSWQRKQTPCDGDVDGIETILEMKYR